MGKGKGKGRGKGQQDRRARAPGGRAESSQSSVDLGPVGSASTVEDFFSSLEKVLPSLTAASAVAAVARAGHLAPSGDFRKDSRFGHLVSRTTELMKSHRLLSRRDIGAEELAGATRVLQPATEVALMQLLAAEAADLFTETTGPPHGFALHSAAVLLASFSKAGLHVPGLCARAAKAIAGMEPLKAGSAKAGGSTSTKLEEKPASARSASPGADSLGDDLAQVACAFARMSWADSHLFERLTHKVLRMGAGALRPAALALIAWSQAAVGLPNHELLGASAREALTRWTSFGPSDLVRIAWALARSPYSHSHTSGPVGQGAAPVQMSTAEARSKFFKSITERLGAGELARLQPTEVASVAWAVAVTSSGSPAVRERAAEGAAAVEFVARCARAAAGKAREVVLEPSACARLCWACSRLGVEDENLFTLLETEAADALAANQRSQSLEDTLLEGCVMGRPL